MKKLTFALLIAAVVNVPVAEAIFIPLSEQPGRPLQAGVPYTFRIGDAANGTAVMLQAVVRSRLELEETVAVPSGSSVELAFTIPSRASRVILVLDLVLNGRSYCDGPRPERRDSHSAKNVFVFYGPGPSP